jgi:hypothetical protein
MHNRYEAKPKARIGDGEVVDPKIKLEARRIANDCYQYITELCTNTGIVNDALKFVQQKTEQIDTLEKLDERIGRKDQGRRLLVTLKLGSGLCSNNCYQVPFFGPMAEETTTNEVALEHPAPLLIHLLYFTRITR